MRVRSGGAAEWDMFPLTGRFLAGRLRHAMTLSEKKLLESLVSETIALQDGEVLVSRGALNTRSSILLEGYMVRTIVHDGVRSIVGLQVPGDFADLHAYALKRLDHNLVALGPCTVGVVEHTRLDQVMEQEPHLARLLWFSTLLDAAIHREWICKLEQLKTAERVAHIFAEIWHRLDMVGLGHPKVIRTPLTQAALGEMCGVTSIHMNRALGQLRREGIATFRRGTLEVDDRSRLESFGAFEPSYLYGSNGLGPLGELSKRPG